MSPDQIILLINKSDSRFGVVIFPNHSRMIFGDGMDSTQSNYHYISIFFILCW